MLKEKRLKTDSMFIVVVERLVTFLGDDGLKVATDIECKDEKR